MSQTVKQQKILVFGTFDMIHDGHVRFFEQARQLAQNPFLVVSIARDRNVKKIKGRLPRKNEQARRRLVAKNSLVDQVILGGVYKHIPHIVKLRPDIIALGYDQTAYVGGLRKDLAKAGLRPKIARLKAYKPAVFKTSLLSNKPSQKSKNQLK